MRDWAAAAIGIRIPTGGGIPGRCAIAPNPARASARALMLLHPRVLQLPLLLPLLGLRGVEEDLGWWGGGEGSVGGGCPWRGREQVGDAQRGGRGADGVGLGEARSRGSVGHDLEPEPDALLTGDVVGPPVRVRYAERRRQRVPRCTRACTYDQNLDFLVNEALQCERKCVVNGRTSERTLHPFKLVRLALGTEPLVREVVLAHAIEAEAGEVLPVATPLAEYGVSVILGVSADAANPAGVQGRRRWLQRRYGG